MKPSYEEYISPNKIKVFPYIYEPISDQQFNCSFGSNSNVYNISNPFSNIPIEEDDNISITDIYFQKIHPNETINRISNKKKIIENIIKEEKTPEENKNNFNIPFLTLKKSGVVNSSKKENKKRSFEINVTITEKTACTSEKNGQNIENKEIKENKENSGNDKYNENKVEDICQQVENCNIKNGEEEEKLNGDYDLIELVQNNQDFQGKNIVNKDLINNINSNIKIINEIRKNNSLLGKKREKSEEIQQDNKAPNFDKIFKKLRIIIIEEHIIFFNDVIKIIYNNDIGRSILTKQFLSIDKTVLSHSSVEFDKKFMNETWEEILSGNISLKYTNYPLEKNRTLIQELVKDKEKCGDYFKELFQLTFLDSLKHITGEKPIDLLSGFMEMDDLLNLKEFDIDENEIPQYKEILINYENLINNKKSRKKRKEKNE